MVSTSVKKE